MFSVLLQIFAVCKALWLQPFTKSLKILPPPTIYTSDKTFENSLTYFFFEDNCTPAWMIVGVFILINQKNKQHTQKYPCQYLFRPGSLCIFFFGGGAHWDLSKYLFSPWLDCLTSDSYIWTYLLSSLHFHCFIVCFYIVMQFLQPVILIASWTAKVCIYLSVTSRGDD